MGISNKLRKLGIAAALCGVAMAVAAQSMPREAFKAKTIFVVNKTGKPTVENGADSELTKWGRFTMADDADSADIRLVLTKAGSTRSFIRRNELLYFEGRGHFASINVEMPPRGRKSPLTAAHTGLQARTTSSRMRLTAFS